MKHAYLIIAHNNFYTLEKLIKLIDDKRNDIYIHIDKKIRNFDFDYYKSIVRDSNLIFVDRIKVNWGGFSQIKSELILFKEASKNEYEYYHLISGVDLPIKTQEYIHNFFRNCNMDFLTNIKSEYIPNEVYQRVSKFYLFQDSNIPFLKSIDKKLIKIQDILKINRWDDNIKLQYGSNWASLTHESVKYIIENEKFIYKKFKYTLGADEVYKQTLLFNNEKYKKKLYLYEYNNYHISYNMRHIDWHRGNPYIFLSEDYEELMSNKALFARKFDCNKDRNIIDKIYKKLMGGIVC
ncbi:beta-1,6-N-acetylglucosaminyltransferase [Intestinibacter bartlettii]|uniref:beta-1,6-N-acetylglucosaminyltransferase n=1 Tax=Intestinibacter bartlettii TaxID=261299 RepID=UPI0034A2A902